MSASVIPFPGVAYIPLVLTTVEEDLPWQSKRRLPAFLDVPKALRLPDCSCIVPHETVMWYMEKLSSLGRQFTKFGCFWMHSDQGKLVVDTCSSKFQPRFPDKGDEIPSTSVVWLTGPDNVRRIYLSNLQESYSNFRDLERILERNLDALRNGKIATPHLAVAVQEIELQLRMKAETKGCLPIEETATFQYFDEWKKANFKAAPKLAEHGGDRKSEERNQGDDGTLINRGSNNASYLAARIKRDHPEIARLSEAGEFSPPCFFIVASCSSTYLLAALTIVETHQNRRHSSTREGREGFTLPLRPCGSWLSSSDTGEAAATENLLRILGEQFSEGLSDVSFPFED